jgi:4-amino-4-deoxy-L-arabinose transferase-like glycosyltransferase
VALVAYVWGVDINGWANPYYSAAAQAGAHDWKAFVFGSLDWNNAITIDKPPLGLWPISLSIRLFGLTPWAIMVPQAIITAASVGTLFALVRLYFPLHIALAAATLFAITPVVFVLSRFNAPDPLMGLLSLLGLYAGAKAIDTGHARWYLSSGVCFGLAVLAKGLQPLLWVPPLAVALLLRSPRSLLSRVAYVALAGTALTAVAVVPLVLEAQLVPSNRPYVGGTSTNNPLDLLFGYNGFDRIAGGAGQGDTSPGLGRLFNANHAQEIAWVLGPALLCILVIATYHRELSRPQRYVTSVLAGILLIGVPLFSFMSGMHTYYTYSLAAPSSAVIAIGLFALVRRARASTTACVAFAILLAGSAYLGTRIFAYSEGWGFWPPILCITCLCAAALTPLYARSLKPNFTVIVVLSCAAFGIGPVATNLATANTRQVAGFPLSGREPDDKNAIAKIAAIVRGVDISRPELLANGAPPSSLVKADAVLPQGAWLVATYPAQNSSMYQLTTGQPALALGGWAGTDPSFSIGGFIRLVQDGRIGYFVSYPLLDSYFENTDIKKIKEWLNERYSQTTSNGVTVYDLRNPVTGH